MKYVVLVLTIVCCGAAWGQLNPVHFLAAPAGPPVVLVQAATPAATLVIAEKALKGHTGVEYEAAKELSSYVKLATGALLPLGP